MFCPSVSPSFYWYKAQEKRYSSSVYSSSRSVLKHCWPKPVARRNTSVSFEGQTNNCCASTENGIFLAVSYLATGHWKCIGRAWEEMLEHGCCSFPQIFMVSMAQQTCSENTSMSENHRTLWILCVSVKVFNNCIDSSKHRIKKWLKFFRYLKFMWIS